MAIDLAISMNTARDLKTKQPAYKIRTTRGLAEGKRRVKRTNVTFQVGEQQAKRLISGQLSKQLPAEAELTAISRPETTAQHFTHRQIPSQCRIDPMLWSAVIAAIGRGRTMGCMAQAKFHRKSGRVDALSRKFRELSQWSAKASRPHS
ncbi:MAG: hypothetical protein U5L08_01540 [Xanthomonadales bacterium]|nr:hypothetical protein [Xanthomonadales bacterium]